ncbi:hypothetical protein ACSVDA_14205 [Cytobacillus sp. Hm23]
MEYKTKLIQLCEKFKSKEYDLIEFQRRLATAIFPEELFELQQSVLNDLEEIRFTELEENFYSSLLKIIAKIQIIYR